MLQRLKLIIYMTIKQNYVSNNMNVIIFLEATEKKIEKILGCTRYLGILY